MELGKSNKVIIHHLVWTAISSGVWSSLKTNSSRETFNCLWDSVWDNVRVRINNSLGGV